MKENLSLIRDILVITTTMTGIVTLYFRYMNNLFLDLSKMLHTPVPNEQSLFNTISKIIFYIITILSIVIIIIDLINIIKNPKILYSDMIPNNKIQFIALIILILFFVWIISIINLFLVLFEEINKNKNLPNSINKKGFTYNHMFTIKKIDMVIAIIFVLFIGCAIVINFLHNNKSNIIDLAILEVFLLSILFILNSLQPVIRTVKKEYIYFLITSSNSISCYCYFKYNDYYLILRENEELYISKNEVKYIKKIKNKYKSSKDLN